MKNKADVLVIGASPNERRYSYIATQMLQDYAHQVFAFGLRKGKIGAVQIELNWPINQSFETVTMYVGPENQAEYYQKIIDLKPKRVIFNPGTENPVFYDLLKENKIAFEEACTLVLLRTGQF